MTLVRFLLTRPSPGGPNVPASGAVSFTPTRSRVVTGGELVLPVPFHEKIGPLGVLDVPLDATSLEWAWRVDRHVNGVLDVTEYVTVPDVAEIDFTDLVRVDPATLEPSTDPEAAWWTAAAQNVQGAEVSGDDLILTRQNGSTFNAGNVRGPQGLQGVKGDTGDTGVQGVQGPPGPATTDASLLDSGTVPEGRLPARLADATLGATYVTPEVGVSRVLAKLHGGQPVKIATIGDSWLEGLTVSTAGNDFLNRIASLLTTRFGSTVTKSNRAVSGYSAFQALDAGTTSPTRFSQALGDAADLYVICFGANDAASAVVSAYVPGSGYPVAAFKGAIEHMIRRIRIDVPGADIILSNQGPMTGSSHSSDGNLETYRLAIREVAAAYGLGFIDFQAALAAVGANGTTPAVDDLYIWPVGNAYANHPTDEGHRIWAEAALKFFPANRLPAPHAPIIPAQPIYGAERYTPSPWIVAPIGRAYGTAGVRYIGSWAGQTTAPQTSTTAGDQVELMFIGTEASIRLDSTVGAVSITVDGEPLNMNLSLSAFGGAGQQRRFPITARDPGIHRVVVTVLSGTVTFRGASYLPAIGQQIKYDSPLITYGGSWVAIGAAAAFWDGNAMQGTATTYVEVTFVGTALQVQCNRFDFNLNYSITVDGGAPYTETWNAGGGGNIPGAKTIVKGLPYGRHTVRVTMGTGTSLQVSTFFAFDETRTLRPSALAGVAVTAEAVKHPLALPAVPTAQITPADSTSTVPPYPSTNTVSTLTVGGTASAKHAWRLEGGRIAY